MYTIGYKKRLKGTTIICPFLVGFSPSHVFACVREMRSPMIQAPMHT